MGPVHTIFVMVVVAALCSLCLGPALHVYVLCMDIPIGCVLDPVLRTTHPFCKHRGQKSSSISPATNILLLVWQHPVTTHAHALCIWSSVAPGGRLAITCFLMIPRSFEMPLTLHAFCSSILVSVMSTPPAASTRSGLVLLPRESV